MYDPNRDYCGPQGLWIARLLPKELFGVSINYCCYRHDEAWKLVRETSDDKEFCECIRLQYIIHGKPITGYVVSKLAFLFVRVGRLGADVKHWFQHR